MGMFDTVFVRCPNCTGISEQQTKSGKCGLRILRLNEDHEATRGLVGDTLWCEHCHKPFEVVAVKTKVVYAVVPVEDSDV